MSTQFLGYGGHALNEGLGLDASTLHPSIDSLYQLVYRRALGLVVRLYSPVCHRRVLVENVSSTEEPPTRFELVTL